MEEPAFPSDAGGSWSPALISWAFFSDLNATQRCESLILEHMVTPKE